jgi:cysteine desulfurase
MRLSDGRVYLDCNATTPVLPQVAELLFSLTRECFGNPSNAYLEGRKAAAVLRTARRQVAALVGCDEGEVIFTSSATEANHLALLSAAAARPARRRVLMSAIEHPSVRELAGTLEAMGCAVSEVPVTPQGAVDLDALEAALSEEVAVVAVMTAHNETGVLQPVENAAGLARSRGALFHTDAVQALGKVPSPWPSARPDYMSVAGHKLYGPKGIGALATRRNAPLRPMLVGGGQERGMRSSTEAVPLAGAFGLACELAAQEISTMARAAVLRDGMEDELAKRYSAVVHGRQAKRLPNTAFVSLPGANGAEIASALDEKGFSVATGSACHGGGSVGLPRVLEAMGEKRDLAGATLRVSLGLETTREDVALFLAALQAVTDHSKG